MSNPDHELSQLTTYDLRALLAQLNTKAIRKGSFSARLRAAVVRELARRETASDPRD